jgi:hypothetical protein
MSAVQWGSVSTWVAGLGTVAAVSVALWEARGERKERLRRELRQQAERISAWFVGMHKDPDGKEPDDGNPDGEDSHRDAWLPPELRGRAADVELLNNSEDPGDRRPGFLVAGLVPGPALVGSRTGVPSHDWRASTRAMGNHSA